MEMGYAPRTKFPYSGIILQSKKGLSLIVDFAKRNQLLNANVTLEECLTQLWQVEEEVYSEEMSDYWDTLRSAAPNCWD